MNKVDMSIDVLFVKQRWVLHVLFWSIILFWYVVFFGRQNSNYSQTFFFVGLVLPVTIGTTYFCNYFLIPNYLLQGRYGRFILYFIYTLIFSVFLEMVVSLATFYLMAELKTSNMSQATFDTTFLVTSLLAVVFPGMAIKLLLNWKAAQENYQNAMLEKVEKELKFLKGQLNPHFLFNTLNNLYYLTLKKSDLAPAAIIQLSEILDYSLYTSGNKYVPLEKEWEHTLNYIKLESLHYQDRLDVETTFHAEPGYFISPMILLTLVENAFKHGALRSKGRVMIKVSVRCSGGVMSIVVSNTYDPREQRERGIGIHNLKNQLDILYHGKHQMNIDTSVLGTFSVSVVINSPL